MIIILESDNCQHKQDVLINCFSLYEAEAYMEESKSIGFCRFCGSPMFDVIPSIIVDGESDSKYYEEAISFPFVINVARISCDNIIYAKCHSQLKRLLAKIGTLINIKKNEFVFSYESIISVLIKISSLDNSNISIKKFATNFVDCIISMSNEIGLQNDINRFICDKTHFQTIKED